MRTLEILIPTYRRPSSAAKAIDSCLESTDHRISVRCNSNGYEPELEKYRNYDTRLVYTCFDENKGPHANFLYLLKNTNARFCMLLSDEDRVDSVAINDMLDYLDNCSGSVVVVSCSVYDTEKKCFYFNHDVRLRQKDYDLNSLLVLGLIPTYMSGLILSVNDLLAIDLDRFANPSMGNAYAHIDIAKQLLIRGRLRLYSSKFVLKGKDICEGGDGYSHRKTAFSRKDGNADLNPYVYGPRARARQFYYSDKMLFSFRHHMGCASYFMAKLRNFAFFYYMVSMSDVITIVDSETNISREVASALREAHDFNEYCCSSWQAYFFCPLSKMPKPIKLILIKILGKFNGLLRVVYIRLMQRKDLCIICVS